MGIVVTVRVVDDSAAFIGLYAVLIDYPFQRGAIAEAVVKGSYQYSVKVLVVSRGSVGAADGGVEQWKQGTGF